MADGRSGVATAAAPLSHSSTPPESKAGNIRCFWCCVLLLNNAHPSPLTSLSLAMRLCFRACALLDSKDMPRETRFSTRASACVFFLLCLHSRDLAFIPFCCASVHP